MPSGQNNNYYSLAEFVGWMCSEPGLAGYWWGCRCDGCYEIKNGRKREWIGNPLTGDQRRARRRTYEQSKSMDRRRAENLKSTFGISLEFYNQMLVAQDGACAICGSRHWGGRWNSPCVDHDHVTGKIRGLLCLQCNRGLGNFKDRIDILARAIAYVERAP